MSDTVSNFSEMLAKIKNAPGYRKDKIPVECYAAQVPLLEMLVEQEQAIIALTKSLRETTELIGKVSAGLISLGDLVKLKSFPAISQEELDAIEKRMTAAGP